MSAIRVPVVEKILSANDHMANENRSLLDQNNVFSINIMASPGAGKDQLHPQTIKHLSNDLKIRRSSKAIPAPVTIDADKIIKAGMPAVQINTGGDCHLEAVMLSDGNQAVTSE